MDPAQVRALYRGFLREARKFTDYNVREYIKRRSRQGFRQSGNAAEAFATGKEQLEVVKRQTVVYSLYAPSLKNVMEIGKARKA
ncbi:LYR motif-containing protein 4-like [Selaginella moellendorffii]|uniref:LYR motif-containing protein 4-like n=1 Tax=Selaginella moellendorffii TaxID=88036 RepID=UPI000D1CF0DD|nr:LYR motif-containing protein 4-like [Selaginella moellendorffii]|eukprot:XP_024534678.1 LYR motif-containing protein 4-like [Selaginella moellendorffii]